MSTPTGFNIPYLGTDAENPRNTFVFSRDPTVTDVKGYKLGDRWINKVSHAAFMFTGIISGQASWLSFSGAGSGFKYLVGIPGSGAPYTSIQVACDDAAADGASVIAQKNVFVLPGTYIENVNLRNYVHIYGFGTDGRAQGAIIEGTLISDGGIATAITNMAINPTIGNSIEMTGLSSNTIALLGCSLNAPSNCISDSSPVSQLILIWKCILSAGIDAVRVTDSSFCGIWDCISISGATAFNMLNANGLFFKSRINSPVILDNTSLTLFNISATSYFNLTNASNLSIKLSEIQTAAEVYTIDATSSVSSVLNEIGCTAGSGFYAVGTGALSTGGNVYSGSAIAPQGTLTVTNYTSD